MFVFAEENLLRCSVSAKTSHYLPFFFAFFDLSVSIMAVIFNGGRRRGGILAFMVVLPIISRTKGNKCAGALTFENFLRPALSSPVKVP